MFWVIARIPWVTVARDDPSKCGKDPDTGFDGTAEGPSDLRTTGQAPAVGHRKLDDPEPRAGRPHLHFEVPAVSHLTHAEPRQRIGADCPERAHIGIPHSTDEADGGADQTAGEQLVRSHAAFFVQPAGPRADHEVEFAVEDRLHQCRDHLRPIAAIAIEKDQDLGPCLDRRSYTPSAGAAVTTLTFD